MPNPEYIRVARGRRLGGNKFVEIFEKDNSMTDLFNQEAERMKNAPKVWVEPVLVFPENMGCNVRAVESRSPIEMMVNKACGYDPAKTVPTVTLRCPVCSKEKEVGRHRTDPEETKVVLSSCAECSSLGNSAEVRYLDSTGKEIYNK